MDRLTTKIFCTDKDHTLKCTCAFTQTKEGTECTVESCTDFCDLQDDCNTCGIQMAINRLAAYEDTGLTPEQIEQMKERLAVDPSGSDKIDEFEEAIGFIEFERDNLKAENARLHALVDNIECVMRGER